MTDGQRLFSGENSKEMWDFINKIKDGTPEDIFWAVYILGCRCQELEAEVMRLKSLVEGADRARGLMEGRDDE